LGENQIGMSNEFILKKKKKPCLRFEKYYFCTPQKKGHN